MRHATIPPGFLKAVVSLGCVPDEFQNMGTGFLYRYGIGLPPNGAKSWYATFLVTNSHVADDGVTHVHFNCPSNGAARIAPMEEISTAGYTGWSHHPEMDVAVTPISPTGPLMVGRKLDYEDGHIFTGMNEPAPTIHEIAEGNPVFVIGFPMHLIEEYRHSPIVRHGIIARSHKYPVGYHEGSHTFLIDSTVFPGNSGSPVVMTSNQTWLRHKPVVERTFLIGLVSAYIPYQEAAVSKQTGRPRIIFEENSGLAEVVPYEFIRHTVSMSTSNHREDGTYAWEPQPRLSPL